MSELKPCPCCVADNPLKRAIPEVGVPSGYSGYRATIKCRDCGCSITRWALKKAWAIESAEAAWNRRAQSANEPITLEELREMDGEPVWCVYPGCSTGGEWFLVNSQGAYKNGSFLNFRYYGEWLAYRTKPEMPERAEK